MLTTSEWLTYLSAVAVLAVMPGPGILYVLARSLRGGRSVGVRSALGGQVGATVHVLAGAFGVSVLLAASAVAFTALKFAGAAYLLYLGIRTLLVRSGEAEPTAQPDGGRAAFVQGIITEALNPKTALFFLAFIPQFVHPDREGAAATFLVLGAVFLVMTFLADVTVALFAGTLAGRLSTHPRWHARQRVVSGLTMVGLGTVTAFAQRT